MSDKCYCLSDPGELRNVYTNKNFIILDWEKYVTREWKQLNNYIESNFKFENHQHERN